jgi:hypothetical protein
MDSALETALNADGPLIFWALELIGTGVTLRLLDGSGTLVLGGNTYVGEHALYGTWTQPSELSDGITTGAPVCAFALHPPSDSAAVTLLDALAQTSAVKVYFGAIDRSTGLLIGYDLRFDGEVDTAVLTAGKNSSIITVEAVSIWDRLFDTDEGLTLTDGVWRSIFSGEYAFQYVAAVQRQLPWGSDGNRASVVFDTPTVSPTVTGGGGGAIGGARDGYLDLLRGVLF